MQQIPHLTIRGKPLAQVYAYGGIIHLAFADWVHKMKKGLTRSAAIEWAREKYYTNNLNIERLPLTAKATLRDNEAEAMRVAAMKRIRDAVEDDDELAKHLVRGDDDLR